MNVRHLTVLTAALLFGACITPKEKKEMQNDLFNVQTRLLSLERNVTDSTKEVKATGDSAAKRVASTQTEIDRVTRDVQQIRGEIDALRVGVTTGKLPGAGEDEEGSINARLTEITERLDALEASQDELLDALKKAGLKGGANSKSSAKKALASVKEMQKAFDSKGYKQIAEEGPKVVKAADGKDKAQGTFLLAESLFKLGKMREAALKYSDYLEMKPSEKNLPLTKMRLGDCFRHLGDGETARVYYEELVKEFPDSDEAAKAKERLAGGGSDGKEKG